MYGGYCRQRRGPILARSTYLYLPPVREPQAGPQSWRGPCRLRRCFVGEPTWTKEEKREKNGEGQRLHHWIRQTARTGQDKTRLDSTASNGGRHSQTEKDLRLCNWGFFELSSGGRDNERIDCDLPFYNLCRMTLPAQPGLRLRPSSSAVVLHPHPHPHPHPHLQSVTRSRVSPCFKPRASPLSRQCHACATRQLSLGRP